MGRVFIVTDSTASLTPEELARYGNITVVPLQLVLGEKTIPDGTIDNRTFFALAEESGVHPQTSRPSPGDFLRVFTPLLDQGGEVIAVLLSGAVSGTVESARIAAEMADIRRVTVMDSLTTSAGLAMLVTAAAEAANKGVETQDIIAMLERRRRAMRTLFMPDSLEYLKKGGRIGGAQALVGTLLQIKPILNLVEGRIEVLDKVRTRQKALVRLAEELPPEAHGLEATIVRSLTEDTARQLQDLIAEKHEGWRPPIVEVSPVIGAHIGPGVVGLIFGEQS